MMDPKLWQDYLRLLEQLTRTIHQLTGIEQNKTRAASQGNLEELESCMRQEQAMSLSLRGHDQKRDALLARMGLTGVPLRELERHAPVDLLMETKRVAETLRREYGLFQTASQVARNTLECNLRMIEKARAQLEGEAPPPGENGDQPSQYELRV